ncbi:hypothetical protein DFH11DRAFT_250196 [Phellopilus nigrolimitatus]|nr:hypothetical protein DFH11DRAFT_250196 [Phellopilus nigrolimitatus]
MNRAAAPVPIPNPTGRRQANLCEHCKARPKYFDGSKLHPYCGKTCAISASIFISLDSTSADNVQDSQAQPLCLVSSCTHSLHDGTIRISSGLHN